MKYLKEYNKFDDGIVQDIENVLNELKDDDVSINILKDMNNTAILDGRIIINNRGVNLDERKQMIISVLDRLQKMFNVKNMYISCGLITQKWKIKGIDNPDKISEMDNIQRITITVDELIGQKAI